MNPPAQLNPISAATHPNPDLYYSELASNKPLYFDPDLKMWIASSFAAVNAVLTSELTSELCRVRPRSEPVPPALEGTDAGEIFRHLVRMTDGAAHCPLKNAVSQTLETLDAARVSNSARGWAQILLKDTSEDSINTLSINTQSINTQSINNMMFQLSSHVLGDLLGLPHHQLANIAPEIEAFARGIAPNCPPETLEAGKSAATRLLEVFGQALEAGEKDQNSDQNGAGLLLSLAAHMRQLGIQDQRFAVCNAIGLLFQAYDSAAGLIGNSLLFLAQNPQVTRSSQHIYQSIHQSIQEVIQTVLRDDPPIQNTRRFVAQDCEILGQKLRAGEMILLVLVAANRDLKPMLGPTLERTGVSFGAGIHKCPGANVAVLIAEQAILVLLERKINLEVLIQNVRYLVSANARVPIFAQPIFGTQEIL